MKDTGLPETKNKIPMPQCKPPKNSLGYQQQLRVIASAVCVEKAHEPNHMIVEICLHSNHGEDVLSNVFLTVEGTDFNQAAQDALDQFKNMYHVK